MVDWDLELIKVGGTAVLTVDSLKSECRCNQLSCLRRHFPRPRI